MENRVLKLRRKKEKAYSECNYDQLYGFCVDLAQIFLENEDYDNALKEFREAEQAGEMANITIYVAKAKRMIGEVYVLIEKPREAIKHVLKYFELSKADGDLKEEQRALATLARTYFVLAESLSSSSERAMALKEAEDYNIKSLLICERLKEITNHKDVAVMKARVYLNLGLVMEAQNRSDKAIEYLEKAVCIGRNQDLWEELSLSYTNLGVAYKRHNDTANSLKAFDLGLAAASRLSEKAKSVCDILLHKAGVLFDLPDFRGAKHALHRAYKMRTPNDDEHQEIAKKLRIVAAVCKLEERLLYMDEENLLDKRKIYESMGDGCAEMESYRKALEYYHLTLKCARKLGESGKKLADIYVSLAQTYRDLKQFDKALDYYHLEYLIWKDNPAEACRTSLSIAEVLEAKGTPVDEIFTTYKSAQCHAKDAKDMKLERSVIKELARYLKEVQDDAKLASIEDELRDIQSKLGDNSSDESDSDSDTNENTNSSGRIGDEICVDTLTDSELDEEEQRNSKPRSSRRSQKPFHFRRNEKGETPLHTACINGNLALVQRLLDQGHPVDVRDNNGWLPLHEAANFGYVDIVRELLDRGAAINDRGGPSCGGITPLLDAASCGHLHVMQLLLEKGASPTVRSNKGETVLDCLRGWRKRYKLEEKRDLDSETLRDYNVMHHKIKTAMEKAGHISKKSEISEAQSDFFDEGQHTSQFEDVRRSPEISRKKGVVPRTNCYKGFSETKSELRRSIDSESTACDNTGSTGHSSNKRYSDEAVTEYEKAIRGLKHRVVRMEVPVSPLKESQDALLEADSITDGWLVDDIGDSRSSRPTKRRRKNQEYLGQQLRGLGESNSEAVIPRPSKPLISSSFSSDSETNDDVPQYYPTIDVEFSEVSSSFPEITRNDTSETEDGDTEEISGPKNRSNVFRSSANSSLKARKHQTSLISTGISCQKIQSIRQQDRGLSNESESVTSSPLTDAACNSQNTQILNRQRTVKVLVEGKLLLIVLPSDHSQLTISWLAEEAARRYKSMEGLEPVLNLQTVEGALLFLQDPLSLIFDVGSEIHATVTSWNLTPITQRYKDACSAANTTLNALVERQLDACQATSCLDVENFGLSSAELIPVFKALAHHHALQHVRLTGNVLGDSGLKALVDTIIRLPQLRELDISCNNISSDGCSYMAHHVSQNGGLQNLETLDVSFNHLGDDSLRSLSVLLTAVPALHTLRLSSVLLTSVKSSIDLPLENIEVLDVSYNQIGQEGARSFLSRLNPDRVCSLNFAAAGKYVGREIAIFLSQSVPHNLVDLNVAYCDIEDADMVPLIECLRSCPQLQKLNLAGNSHLSVVMTQQLMQLSLADLNLGGVCSYMPLVSTISNLCISSNVGTTTGNTAPFSVITNNLKSIMSMH